MRIAVEPLQVRFACTTDPKTKNISPWSWQLWAGPSLGATGSGGSSSSAQWVNLFQDTVQGAVEEAAATKCQAGVRGMSSRRRVRDLRGLGQEIMDTVLADVFDEIDVRSGTAKATHDTNKRDSREARGKHEKGRSSMTNQKNAQAQKNAQNIGVVQAFFLRYKAQSWVQELEQKHHLDQHAARIQSSWRGKLAREHVSSLSEEALWPMKGWFEYTATGQEAVQVDVRFLPNPGFDDFKFFTENGPCQELSRSVEDMEADISARVGEDDPWRLEPTENSRLLLKSGGASPAPEPDKRTKANKDGKTADKKPGEGQKSDVQKPDAPNSDAQRLDAPKSEAKRAEVHKSDAGLKLEVQSTDSQRLDAQRPDSNKLDAKRSDAKKPEEQRPEAQKSDASKSDAKRPGEQKSDAKKPDAQKPAEKEKGRAEPKADRKKSPSGESRGVAPAPSKAVAPSPAMAVPKTSAAKAQSAPKAAQPPPAKVQDSPPRPKAKAESRDLAFTDSGDSVQTGGRNKAGRSGCSDGEGGVESEVTLLMPQKRSPKKPKEQPSAMSKFLADQTEGQFAHKFLARAAVLYEDRAPARLADDKAPPPPESRPPQNPSPPSPSMKSSAGMRTSPSASKVEMPQSYAGVRVGNQFVRAAVTSVDDLSAQQREAILNDMQRHKEQQVEVLEAKKQLHAKRKQEELAKAEKRRGEKSEFEASETERREQKVVDMKKWLRKKDDEARTKRAKDDEVFQTFMEKEREKSEIARKAEEAMQEQRERRLRIAERQRSKIEAQQAAAQAGKTASQMTSVRSAPSLGSVDAQASQQGTQRIIHRHIHHHVHYHEGGDASDGGGEADGSGPLASPDAQRQLEVASEERVRQQLEQQQQAKSGIAHSASTGQIGNRILPRVDGVGEARRPSSTGGSNESSKMSRPQEVFLPQVDLQDPSRRLGLVAYPRNVERAIGSYADSGRPNRRNRP
jgi:hypothetical protein